MIFRKSVKQIVESADKPVPFMTLLNMTLERAAKKRLMESAEGAGVDTTEGLDELSDNDTPGEDGFDGDDLEGSDKRETVTITVPVDATIEEIADAMAAAQAGNDDADAELDAEADAAADEAADEVEADIAADDAADEAGFERVEEDEEAFASTRAEGPSRKIASTTYKNQMTVDSNISPTVSMGKPATIADGSPKRRPASGTYDNGMTVKSKIQNGTRWFQ